MIITIVFLIFFIIGIIIIVNGIRENSEDGDFLAGGAFIVISLGVIIPTLIYGYSFEGNPIEKARIEYEIENTYPNFDALKEAQEYNKSVNDNNNYWFRFTIEDRSQWLIDVNKYLEDKSE